MVDSLLERRYRAQLEQNNTGLLDTMISNISDTLIQPDKAARLRMLWQNLTVPDQTQNDTGDCTQVSINTYNLALNHMSLHNPTMVQLVL